MKPSSIYIVMLESLLIGILVSIFMAYVALNHNPQNEFYDEGVVVGNLLSMMASWVVVCGAVYGLLRTIVIVLVKKLRQ